MGSITILVDTRENYPLPFPAFIDVGSKWQPIRVSIKTQPRKLDAGDYCLAESPDSAIVERKASRNELATNLFDPKDQKRALRAFKRLSEATAHPILLLEVSPHELFLNLPRNCKSKVPMPGVTGDELLSRITTLSARLGLSLLWFSRTTNRRLIGTIVAHTLFAYATEKDEDFLKKLLTSSPK